MSMSVDDLSEPRGETARFTNVGDKIVGTVTFVGPFRERINKLNNKPETSARIVLDCEDGETRVLYINKGSFLADALGNAIRDAGSKALDVGGKLAVALSELRDTGKPQPAKVYKAQYKPPAAGGGLSEEDLF